VATEYACPYYSKTSSGTELRRGGRLYCEGATLKFPDAEARCEIVDTYCGNSGGYKQCPIKVMLDHYYYDRKYNQDKKG
jgi:hypothetical protein